MKVNRQSCESLFFRRTLLVSLVVLAACSSSRTDQLSDARTAEDAGSQPVDARTAADADAAYMEQPCSQRREATCAANDGCFAIRGIPFVELCQGRQALTFAGCVPVGPDGGPAITWGRQETSGQIFQFPTTQMPDGWAKTAEPACVLDGGVDSFPDSAKAVVGCEANPVEGDLCAGIQPGYVCRQGNCLGGCSHQCSCVDGVWRCGVGCRDFNGQPSLDAFPFYCGTAPLCWADCYMPPPDLDAGRDESPSVDASVCKGEDADLYRRGWIEPCPSLVDAGVPVLYCQTPGIGVFEARCGQRQTLRWDWGSHSMTCFYEQGVLVGLTMTNDIPSFCANTSRTFEVGSIDSCPQSTETMLISCDPFKDGGYFPYLPG